MELKKTFTFVSQYDMLSLRNGNNPCIAILSYDYEKAI